MKRLLFILLISSFACGQTTVIKNKEEVKVMSSWDYFQEANKWLKVSDEYLAKRMYYVGRNDMTPEDHRKYNEYEALCKMAMDSAKYYMDISKRLDRSDTLKATYERLNKK